MSEISIESFCGGLFQTNGYLLRTGTKAWLFDAPEGIADWLEEQGVTLGGLFLTHQHHDHVIGAGAVQSKFDCPIYAFAEPSEDLTMAKRLEQMMGIPCELESYRVDSIIKEGSFALDGLDLEVIHVPGHSPDSICFLVEGAPILIGGDVLFDGGIGRTDFPNGDHDLLLTGIKKKLWPLDDEVEVLPGHGGTTTLGNEKATNPFLQ